MCLRKIFGIGHVCLRSFEKFRFEEWRRQRDGAEWVDPTDDPTKDDPTTDDRLSRVQTFSSQWIKSDERRNEWSWDASFFVLDKIARKKNLRSRLALSLVFLLQPKRSLAQWCAAHDSNQKSDVRIQPNLILRMQYLFPSRWIDYKVKTRSIEIVVFQHYDSRVALNVLKLSINQIDVFWVFL